MVSAGIARQPQARMVYVTPSHQFPLGVTMSLARRLALLRMGEAQRRLGDRGRLRQRVPLLRPAHRFPPGPRLHRPRDLPRERSAKCCFRPCGWAT